MSAFSNSETASSNALSKLFKNSSCAAFSSASASASAFSSSAAFLFASSIAFSASSTVKPFSKPFSISDFVLAASAFNFSMAASTCFANSGSF